MIPLVFQGFAMLSRSLVAVLAVAALSACDHGDKAAIEADAGSLDATAVSPGQAALVEIWQSAHVGVAPPALPEMAAAFDPAFATIARADNDADNAFIKSTLTFLKAVQATQPGLCAEAPLARFTAGTLAAVPADALPAFRAMLTDRLAVVADGAGRAAPAEELMSGSMQNFTTALGETYDPTTAPTIAAAQPYDPAAGCAATIKGWEALDAAPQSPQLMQMFYELSSFAPQ